MNESTEQVHGRNQEAYADKPHNALADEK
jgi:hypothetical protein